MIIFYRLFIQLYLLAIRMAGTWNKKAAEWIRGRINWQGRLAVQIAPADRIIWIHCASAGELEQGKPIVEALKKNYPHHKVLLSFFSPSGFAAGKKYGQADFITYLPADTRRNAARFVAIARPELVVFIKYEYWHYHLSRVAAQNIPLLLVSAIFRKEQAFFRPYGTFFRNILSRFSQIFVQDEASAHLLRTHGIEKLTVSGDTRFDRVREIAGQFTELPLVGAFVGTRMVIVAGSTWPHDEALWAAFFRDRPEVLIVAPHEIHAAHLQQIRRSFPGAILYSELAADPALRSSVLVMDNFGMLSRLYHYASIAYIGGGFNSSGIHNTLEAAVYGKPVLFGPNYQKFREARELIACGGAFSIGDAQALRSGAEMLLKNETARRAAGKAAKDYVASQAGATQKVLQYIQENRLLTS